MKQINVLSLFDGKSDAQLALEMSEIPVANYYASEIDSSSIKVTMHNFPKTKQLGDITKLKYIDWTQNKIDLVIGGSPCQGFSIAGKKLNFDDERSGLFFEYVRILNEIKAVNPKVKFLLENVRMPNHIADAIDELLGVKRVFIDSIYFTGMIRKRYYWTNIPIFELPSVKIPFKSILENHPYDRDLKFFLDRTAYAPTTSSDGIITINPKDNNGKQTWQRGRVYDIRGNCPTICATLFDLNITEDHKTYRKMTISECERAQGVKIGYTDILNKNEAGKALGNGFNVPTVSHILKGMKD